MNINAQTAGAHTMNMGRLDWRGERGVALRSMLAGGKTAREIAEHFGVPQNKVRDYIRRNGIKIKK